jgi:hypothetical protein
MKSPEHSGDITCKDPNVTRLAKWRRIVRPSEAIWRPTFLGMCWPYLNEVTLFSQETLCISMSLYKILA